MQLEPGPRGTPGGEAAQEAVSPRNRSIRSHLVTKCTVKHVSNQSVPSEQLKHTLNARKQSKTSAKRAKTVHLTRKIAKARQPIACLETLSNQSMNESKASTIGRFTGLSSVYPQLHNRDTFSVLNSIDRFAAKNKQVNPQPESRTIEQRNVISQIAIELLFFVSFLYDCITSEIGFQCTNSPNRSVSGKKRSANPTGHESKTIEQSKGEIDNRECMN